MFHFPYLESLVKKNDKYKIFFRKTRNKFPIGTSIAGFHPVVQERRDHNSLKNENKIMNSTILLSPNTPSENHTEISHWKKRFRMRYELEVNTKSEDGGNFRKESSKEKVETLLDWQPGSSLRLKLSSLTVRETHDDKVVTNQGHLLDHKTAAQTASGEFCYLPFFAKGKNNLLLKRKQDQGECKLCDKWLKGVSGNVQAYLQEIQPMPKICDEGKRRGRKCKSMARRVCELCSKILSNRKGLERHMLIHTGEKPFPCDVCGKPFRRKDNCVRHKKTAHLFKKPRKPRRRRENNICTSGGNANI